ncbi:ribose transport system substrate-binding protein [Natronobacillus azotifigens]|uniref:Substrate-binding domain-containing protein n=1 Tax=Natronobacillus azotifigens TaxID=472978 RepID=A0A9J6RC52_9BACI|nr:substrate-binding domain-containing protein [Natronobacillus azotifigens]MCZ0702923.1 substrate-binding domain-containing protein [Natronobacillus azotifigens]
MMRRNGLTGVVLLVVCVLIVYMGYLMKDILTLQQRIEEEKKPEMLNGRPHIIMIGEVEDHLYWNIVRDAAKDYAQENELYLQYKGPRDSDPDEQLSILRRVIDVQPDGIIVQSLTEAFIPLIDEAISLDIPVITVDSDQPMSQRVSYVGTDNLLAGEAIAEDVLAHVDDVHAGIITGTYTNYHHQLRLEGFKEVIDQAGDASIVDVASSGIKRVNAREKAYQMMINHPEINVMLGISALDVLGITEAIDVLGREDIYVVGFDTLEENLQLLKQGKVQTLASQEPHQMGMKSMEIIEKIIQGESVPDVIHTNSQLVKDGSS